MEFVSFCSLSYVKHEWCKESHCVKAGNYVCSPGSADMSRARVSSSISHADGHETTVDLHSWELRPLQSDVLFLSRKPHDVLLEHTVRAG